MMKISEYYLVHGWHNASGGVCDDKFYGAVIDLHDNNLAPRPIVLEGPEAIDASRNATGKTERVHPGELYESVTGTGAIAIHPGMAPRGGNGYGHIDGLGNGKQSTKERRGVRDPVRFVKQPSVPHNNRASAYLRTSGERVTPNNYK